MREQKHLIKRQVIELTVSNRASAAVIQDQVSRIYRERIVPLIEQYCSELSAPDRLYRIDTLELDLGRLDPHDLEAQMVAKVSTSLRAALASEIRLLDQVQHDSGSGSSAGHASASSPKALSALELFGLFISSGNLPWWADHNNPNLLAENLQQLLDGASSAFIQLLKELAREHALRQRIASHYGDQQLGQLLALLIPAQRYGLMQETPTLIVALQKAAAGRSWSAAWLRQLVWCYSLQVAALGGQQYPTLAAFYQAVLERVAHETGISSSSLLDDMLRVLQEGKVAHGQPLQATLADCNPARRGRSDASDASDTSARPHPDLTQDLIRLQRGSTASLLAAWSQLRAQAGRFSTELQAQLHRALTGTPQQAAEQVLACLQAESQHQPDLLDLCQLFASALAASSQPETQLAALLRRLQSHGGPLTQLWGTLRTLCWQLPAEAQQHWLAALADVSAGDDASHALSRLLATPQANHGLRADECARLQQMLRLPPSAALKWQHHFNAAEELSVANAGMVILWPFLSHFFAHLGLLEQKDFKDLAARQRAVGILQLLATREASFAEYLLPLNKVLCGLELAHPFEFDPPPNKRERRECSKLLAAVIAQAPILNNMSEAGFRGSFLLRPGLLSQRDGHWLLRVERQTFDIVLERFPWSWSWVKLPWMAGPLRVEW